MEPSGLPVEEFLDGLTERRRNEAHHLIEIMSRISGEPATMWGPSIIGFGSVDYRYDSGRSGSMPISGFSPRKAALTIYISEGFDRYGDLLTRLGKHKTSVSCLYITKLPDVDVEVLTEILERSYAHHTSSATKPDTVEQYLAAVPQASRDALDELRRIVSGALPGASEVLSYGIIGYKPDPAKRAVVFVSGWKDHVALYPVPKSLELAERIAPYVRGKGTMWFDLDENLPAPLIADVVRELAQQ